MLLFILASFQTQAQKLRAELAMARFDSPNDNPYLETCLRFSGNTLSLSGSRDSLFSEVAITMVITKKQDTIYQNAYRVKGPILSDSLRQDFIDVNRIGIDFGKLVLTMTLQDVYSDNPAISVKQELDVLRNKNVVTISDMQLIDSYVKTLDTTVISKVGYDLIPKTSNVFMPSNNEITLYCEIYNTNFGFNYKRVSRALSLQNTLFFPFSVASALTEYLTNKKEFEKFLVDIFIEGEESGEVVANLRKFAKKDAAKIVPILQSFPLTDVPSGNYNLIVEVKNSKNVVIDRRMLPFKRINNTDTTDYEDLILARLDSTKPIFTERFNRQEQLVEYLRCLHPISNQQEITFVNREVRKNYYDMRTMQLFMYNFWVKRNPSDPEGAWMKYLEQVEKVNANYTTNQKKGYDTDRGRVYLQYGPPNTISPNYFEPDTYPYEIWHYYVLRDHLYADQSNKKFIFAQVNEGTNDFILIHSDAKNEVTNSRWNYDLHKRSSQNVNLDVEDAPGSYGNRSRQFFDNPY